VATVSQSIRAAMSRRMQSLQVPPDLTGKLLRVLAPKLDV
jgi:hypothetical protein